jgi:PAS domain S-box-containing protein
MLSFHVLSLMGIASIVVVLAAIGFAVSRTGLRALAYWFFAWDALLSAGFVTLLKSDAPELAPLVPLFSTFVAPLMLLGAFAHSHRPEPPWLLLGGFIVAAVRVAALLVGANDVSIAPAIVLEPALGLAAAWIVLRPRRDPPNQPLAGDRMLAVGFVLYAATEGFDAFRYAQDAHDWMNWAVWVGVGLPLATIQIVLHLDRFGRRARRSEEDARSASNRLEMLSGSHLDFIAEFDPLGVVTYVSPGASIAAGLPRAELIGRNVREFLDPAPDSKLARKLIETGRITPEDVEAATGTDHPARLPDGSIRWYEFAGTTYQTLDGEDRIVSQIRDVTSRVLQQNELRASEARLRRAERIARIGSWDYDVSTNHLVFSDELLRILALEQDPANVDPETVKRLVHPDDHALAVKVWADARDHGISGEQLVRINRADDGETRTLRILTDVDRDEEGQIVRVAGATIDLTDQVELTKRLHEGQRRFSALVDSNIVCVYFTDRCGRITEANDAFLSLIGYSRSELPLDPREYYGSDTLDRVQVSANTWDDSFLGHPIEREFVAKDGHPVPLVLTWVALPPDSAIVIAADVSERKRAEADRERYREALEETIALRNRELLESRSRLIEQERLVAIGTLTAGVAHQINNPIGAILNCSEYALICRDDDEVLAIFERALRDNLAEAQRCAQIVKSMLQFSRDQPTAKWVEDLGRVVRRAHRVTSAYAHDRGANVALILAEDSILARISPIEIEQAIVNVLRNAIESKETGANVTLQLGRRDKSAFIEINDDGRGIPAENLERLFEPFFSTRTREGGTGLGLSVTHGVVIDHGGEVRVESVPGVGTRVLISLPLEEDRPDSRRGNFSDD